MILVTWYLLHRFWWHTRHFELLCFQPSGSIVLPSFSVMWTDVTTTIDCMIKVKFALATTASVQTTRWFCFLLSDYLQTYIPAISRCCFVFCSPHITFWTRAVCWNVSSFWIWMYLTVGKNPSVLCHALSVTKEFIFTNCLKKQLWLDSLLPNWSMPPLSDMVESVRGT